ncbi:YdaS family helix-turn-helix protein [Achromobacter anxifer]
MVLMCTQNPSRPAIEKAIGKAGSQAALARLLGKKQPHIHKWLNSSKALKAEHCSLIEARIGVTRQELRPLDYWIVWPELARQPGGETHHA